MAEIIDGLPKPLAVVGILILMGLAADTMFNDARILQGLLKN